MFFVLAPDPICAPCHDQSSHTAKQCEERGAKILLNTEVTKELLDREGYDAVVIAAGATPVIPRRIPGVDKPHVAWAPDAAMGKLEVGERVMIVGAGTIGVEAALDFTRAGKKVT
ncbi:MAG: FAD-dependent oxidoreductase, partial [Bacteroidales bacterium]|nr:FAD-dependent oxidoreductase [Bacteroidales bacterium]